MALLVPVVLVTALSTHPALAQTGQGSAYFNPADNAHHQCNQTGAQSVHDVDVEAGQGGNFMYATVSASGNTTITVDAYLGGGDEAGAVGLQQSSAQHTAVGMASDPNDPNHEWTNHETLIGGFSAGYQYIYQTNSSGAIRHVLTITRPGTTTPIYREYLDARSSPELRQRIADFRSSISAMRASAHTWVAQEGGVLAVAAYGILVGAVQHNHANAWAVASAVCAGVFGGGAAYAYYLANWEKGRRDAAFWYDSAASLTYPS